MKRALLSVSDKTGLVDLARVLVEAGIELVSTGGTAKALRDAGLTVLDVSQITGFPEMMDGRVKTLHPIVHGGLLYVRDNAEHQKQAKEHGIIPIDYVIVNLYPFEETIQRPDVTLELAIENIDIGGPSMLRSAAKNYRSVTVVVDPDDYAIVAEQVKANGVTTLELREKLAAKVFHTTSYYDSLIAEYLSAVISKQGETLPENLILPMRKAQSLRYGENPHQHAALYGDFPNYFKQLHGKELSYNNLIDISAAVNLIGEFHEEPTLAILKHTNPCGVGAGKTLREAWDLAYATDRQAPFGGIIVVNRPLDLAVAEAIAEIFSEVIIAPAFEPDALALLEKKKNLRLILNRWSSNPLSEAGMNIEFKSIVGDSILVQTSDSQPMKPETWKVVTKRQPTEAELKAMLFGWRVVKHVKSNAIVYANQHQTLGVGAGQMSRVDSSKIAVWKAGEAKLNLKGSVVASDAFFPFADGLIAAAEAGATAAIEPGGSVRDEEVIAAANERNMTMLFTGKRHFRH
ncbi:MAG: bifunctional phosphoribosylaminoimidazolecarboxamide formyltransferase/IMP cyclohydrolase [Verrucomicrobia bacterium Tous-C9LFEB]|nr:MAG: bifunctional phosphoribosylaminoimidazolecarboxamide formyltransferase/IMP cyclohydrolase [Verrucomicrobia bacterium Tous-C9LFEB]